MIPADWEILISNRQRTRRLDTKKIREILDWLLVEDLGLDHVELGIHFVSAKEMARVHEQYMDIAGSTDVITFDHGSKPPIRIHGEIFISLQDAEEQARAFKTDWQSETIRYVIHGVLHLLGLDDTDPRKRMRMKAKENMFLQHVKKRFDVRNIEKR